MLSSVSSILPHVDPSPRGTSAAPGTGSVAALDGQILQDKIQLNDWLTCVSAKTPKGQAAIQKLSGEISAAKDQIYKAQNQQAAHRSGSIDVWA